MNSAQHRVELWAVALISVAAVLSAWCAYQSARWGNAQAQSYAQASAARVESVRQSDLANRQTLIDIDLFIEYHSAVASRNTALVSFVSQRFPDRLKPAVNAWLATKPFTNARAPSSPFVMPEYHVDAQDRANALESDAKGYFQTAVSANDTANRYVLMTVLFASVSFLAGVGSKFDVRKIAMAALLLGSVVLLVAGVVLIGYPVR
jgi:hypothetical protein